MCTADSDCGSYECSPTELKCNLNEESDPNQSIHLDYEFMTKTTTASGTTSNIMGDPGKSCTLACSNVGSSCNETEQANYNSNSQTTD